MFPAPNEENNYLATIDPVLLQIGPTSDSHFEQQGQPEWDEQNWSQQSGSEPEPPTQCAQGPMIGPTVSAPSTFTVSCPFSACEIEFGSEDALREHTSSSHVGQHFIVSKSPFKCHCGQEFTKLSSLERHVRGSDKRLVSKHPCHECTTYQGKDGFMRKDHLLQHLRVFHKYDNDQLATLFRPRQARMYNIPVCHFESCEYYRGPEFKDTGIRQQENNRPFDKQSDYTMHMKREHDWSPYPCKVSGCNKLDGKGFFSITALEKHCKEKHPGCTISVQKPQNGVVKTVRCDYCHKDLKTGSLVWHQTRSCELKEGDPEHMWQVRVVPELPGRCD
ncbi:hypothetical protein GGR55DRAFT_684691 [Xylaria sp. FL0064]|nr:hypothetical protein GGR55DRAFT_684691 [Xylaria sp. FL0064]